MMTVYETSEGRIQSQPEKVRLKMRGGPEVALTVEVLMTGKSDVVGALTPVKTTR